MYIQWSPFEIKTPTPRKTDQPQHDYPIACVIAQQYSSAIFISLRSHSRTEKFGVRLKDVTFQPLFFLLF
jgi:hypothetical protein